jgi:4-hydroxybenzoyl-CoA reductase subunit beta
MLRLPAFEYLAPRTLEEAARMLAEAGAAALPVAGGTDLFPNMKRRQMEPRVLVGLRGVAEMTQLSGSAAQGWRLGAGITLARLAAHPELRQSYPAVALAAESVATPTLRNMGTVGGNLCVDTRCNYYNQSYEWRRAIGFCMKRDGDICLVAPSSPRCWAVSSCDTAPALMALGASVRLVSAREERVIALRELYRDDGIDYLALKPGEILSEIMLPPADGWRSTYRKLRRRGSFDFPILGVAVALRIGANAIVEQARVCLAAAASHPLEAVKAAEMLAGKKLQPDVIAAVANEIFRVAKPVDNSDLTLSYRKRMARVLVERALRDLAEAAASGRNGQAPGA